MNKQEFTRRMSSAVDRVVIGDIHACTAICSQLGYKAADLFNGEFSLRTVNQRYNVAWLTFNDAEMGNTWLFSKQGPLIREFWLWFFYQWMLETKRYREL